MAIQILGVDGNTVQAVDPQFNATRTSMRPVQCLGRNSVAAPTGIITVIAAGGAIFSFRNISANLIMVRRVGIGFVCTTAFTTAQRMEFRLTVARAFTASDTGGTALALTGDQGKHRTSLSTPTSVDCRISGVAALTAGTKTLDTINLGYVGFWVAGVGSVLQADTADNLFSHNSGDYPLILAQNEGFNILNSFLMGAAGAGVAYVSMEFAEVTSF